MNQNASHHANRLFDFGPMAQEYEHWYGTPTGQENDRIQQQDVRALLPPAKNNKSLLDVGCGTGHWSRFFLSLGYQVRGMDLSPEMIEKARQMVEACTFTQADACDIPYPNQTFDVMAAMAMIEFIPTPEVAIREMIRCLRPGGILIIGTLNRTATINRRRLMEERQPYASAHLYAPEELHELLSSHGPVHMLASSRVYWNPQKPSSSFSTQQVLNGPFLVAKVQI